jgi:hypothetical protein
MGEEIIIVYLKSGLTFQINADELKIIDEKLDDVTCTVIILPRANQRIFVEEIAYIRSYTSEELNKMAGIAQQGMKKKSPLEI